MDAAIESAIQEKSCPGGVLWLEHNGEVYSKAYGSRALIPQDEPMTVDTIFDLASLTKVIATTPAVLLLTERGQIDLEQPVQSYIPEFTGGGKEKITVRHLLLHTSGLRPGIETRTDWTGQAAALQRICREQVVSPPGESFRYSDINFILLGVLVQRVAKVPLEQFVALEIYTPLRMVDTGYLPPSSGNSRIAPTEVINGEVLRGVVHDPTARKMGGVAGHAGLFSTASDLARYARMLLNLGELDGVRIFKPETVRLMTTVQTPDGVTARRGLGWDIDSPYSGPRGRLFPVGSYGHTGWTGTSLWLDPFSKTFVIFLSNRNHPNENGSVLKLRNRLGTLAAESIADFEFAAVNSQSSSIASAGTGANRTPPVRTLNGIDVLVRQKFAPLRGMRIGLLTNHTGHDRDRNSTIDLLRTAPDVELKVLFSPEHGIRGQADERLGDTVDEKTGLPVFSLYGSHLRPTAEQLQGLDALVFDIQDIGCRFYTYTATMAMAMEAAAEHGKKFFVLDRVDPINGERVEGPVLNGAATFVGYHQVPLRYGMTIGELAKMFNAEHNCHADLTVIPLENWSRTAYFDETGLPWTNPSPNMRSPVAAILYPGVGLLESALSVGRGTDTPFQLVGAPYVSDVALAEELNAEGLPGIRFVPVTFTPSASTHKGQLCRGVEMVVTDRERLNSVDVGLLLAKTLFRCYPKEFDLGKISHLLLHPPTFQALKDNQPLDRVRALWQPQLDSFKERRQKFLLYR
jgi:uncharacterized protein YbbC (DUF1343 family)/CubicO group peptidase (beta-lactamase class C family)